LVDSISKTAGVDPLDAMVPGSGWGSASNLAAHGQIVGLCLLALPPQQDSILERKTWQHRLLHQMAITKSESIWSFFEVLDVVSLSSFCGPDDALATHDPALVPVLRAGTKARRDVKALQT